MLLNKILFTVFIMISEQTITAAANFIKVQEGYIEKPYRCPAGLWTIGYGHQIKENEISYVNKEKAEELLRKDVEERIRKLYSIVKVELNQNQIVALTSLLFNIGETKFKKLKLVKKLNNNESFEEVAKEFLDIVHANGKKLNGLVKRRQLEHDLFLTVPALAKEKEENKSIWIIILSIIQQLIKTFKESKCN